MESKRKANGHAPAVEDLDDRAAKRRKVPDVSLDNGETAETTTQYGLPFIEQVKRTADKSGRLVATNFLTLPSKRDLPDYYKVIKMPIALDTIEDKLKRREFPNLTSLESFCKRMISNAKEYNQKGSEIYDDAERIRKALSNFMTKNNPAYRKPGYVAFPTPIPTEDLPEEEAAEDEEDEEEEEVEDAEGSDEDAEGEADMDTPDPPPPSKRQRGRPPKNQTSKSTVNGRQKSETPGSVKGSHHGAVGFQGLTFQQAQEKLVSDMIEHKEDEEDDFATFEPFINLPPRTLKDYYQIITHPISLKGLQKRVRGNHGRAGSTGVSDFKSWRAFEEEAEKIWHNAWHYNEDGSDIAVLAQDLEIFFNKSLAQAKKHVPEPTQPKLKLKMSSIAEPTPKITLRMGGRPSPAESPAPPASNSRDDSPQNGIGLRRNPFGNSQKSSNVAPSLDHLERTGSLSGSAASPSPSVSAVIKNEEGSKASPSLPPTSAGLNQGNTNGINRPVSSLLANGTTMLPPTSTTPVSVTSNFTSALPGQSYSALPTYHTPNTSFESKWRQPGKDASDAMITNLSLATHPGLNISRHLRMNLPPSATMSQQSITITLPHTHYYLQIKPTIALPLLERQHKLFVTSGTTRLHAMPTIPGHNVDPRHPLFEARLLPGVNRIEIELIAALPKGAPKPANGSDVELEKITIFANLLRNEKQYSTTG